MKLIALFAVSLGITAVSTGNVYSIAFTAALTDDIVLMNGQGLKYQRVLLNSGNAYNNRTGIFTCPQSGIYNFQFHGFSVWRKDMLLQLTHNHDFVVSFRAFNGQAQASGSNSAVIHLKRGDQVWVKSLGTSNVRGRHDTLFTTFSGYLIAPSF